MDMVVRKTRNWLAHVAGQWERSRRSRPAAPEGLSAASNGPVAVFDSESTADLLLKAVQIAAADPSLTKGGRRQLRRLRACLTALRHADEVLCAAYTRQALPLPLAATQIALRHRASYAQLADAFQTLAQAEIRQRSSPELLLDTVGGVLNCLKNVLLISLLTYAAPPEGFWRRCHELYAFALRVGSTAAKRGDATPLATLTDLYKHVLLLGLADTYSMPAHVLVRLDQSLAELACYAVLTANNEPDTSEQCFGIALDQDAPPRNMTFAQRSGAGTPTHWLDTRDLVAFLKRGPRQAPPPLVQAGLRKWNVDWRFLDEARRHELAALWSVNWRRRGTRGARAARALATFGLADTHALLVSARDQGGDATPDSLPARISHPVAVVNGSAHGVCLLWKADASLAVGLGALIGLFDTASASEPWAVGVVRWLKNVPAPYLMMGVQLLAPGATPVIIRLQHTVGKFDRPLPGLVLPASASRPASLITPALIDEAGCALTISNGGETLHVRLRQRISATAAISRFVFETAQATAVAAATGDASKPMNDGQASSGAAPHIQH